MQKAVAELEELGLRLAQADVAVTPQKGAACCYAKSDKYWTIDPQGVAWESFHTLDAVPVYGADSRQNAKASEAKAACCWYLRRALAEGLGTALLLAAVVGSGIMGEQLSAGNNAVALLANSIATGLVLFALIVAFAPRSGAHFNPVITILLAVRREVARADIAPYLTAQFTGAILGVLLAHDVRPAAAADFDPGARQLIGAQIVGAILCQPPAERAPQLDSGDVGAGWPDRGDRVVAAKSASAQRRPRFRDKLWPLQEMTHEQTSPYPFLDCSGHPCRMRY